MTPKPLAELDFENLEELIHWIESICEATPEHKRPIVDPDEIIRTFEEHGFMRDFVPVEKDIHDPDEYARWIISQALKDLDIHGFDVIRGVHSVYTQKWIALHGSAQR